MITIELSEFGAFAERIKRGETLEVLEAGRLVATIVPVMTDKLEEQTRRLAADGLVRIGTREPLPPEFFTEELPRCEGGSIVDELIRDRDED